MKLNPEQLFELLVDQNHGMRSALNELASWGEGPHVNSSFDEPNAARVAREALERFPDPFKKPSRR